MSLAIEKLQAALQRAMAGRPKAGGFPYLAETLRRVGVVRNPWFLPACESLFNEGRASRNARSTVAVGDGGRTEIR